MVGEVRRIVEGGVGGYGVYGESFDNLGTEESIFALRGASAANDMYYASRPITDLATHTFVVMRWRWSYHGVVYDRERLKVYDNVLGIAQHGRSVMSAYGYRTDDVFISADDQKSKIYSCVFSFSGADVSTEDPCDEPQEEFLDEDMLVGGFMGYSFEQFVSKGVPGTLQNLYTTQIADMASFGMSAGVLSYRIGITFVYRIYAFTTEQWESELAPPRIIF